MPTLTTTSVLEGSPEKTDDNEAMNEVEIEEEEDSDVEMEGIDQEGDDEEILDVSMEAYEQDDTINEDKQQVDSLQTLAINEAKDMEAAKKERIELMASEQNALEEQKKKKDTTNDSNEPTSDRLNYLLAQSEVFAHFLAGSVATDRSKTKKKSPSTPTRGNKANRLTEAEEDAQLLKCADSKRRIVRLSQQPSLLSSNCKMHPYQLEGLNWLIKLHDHGINGILADEMGLGKTLQTISLLAYLRERGVKGPHLIIVPKSVVGNWMREFKMWCGAIKPVRMGGTKDEREVFVKECLRKVTTSNGKDWRYEMFKHDVLVTSYEGVLKEKSKLKRIDWKYMVIDEAHRIKNENSSLSIGVRLINTQFRLLLTGTPLQNNLHELWALLNFLLPDIFGDADEFDQWFNLSGSDKQENVIRKLHTVLRPFMIRRVKKDVAKMLPPKKETKLYVGLTPMQQEWYKRVLRKEAFTLNSLGGPEKSRLMNVLMQLRKVCNHPYLFDGAEPGPPYTDGPHLWDNCGKLSLLHKLLPKLKAKGSRILIFSQMTRILDIMEDYLRLLGYQYCRIDGNTSGDDRDSQMDEFNEKDSAKFCFLLSTRAGGLGINLATADIVILYDSDWNPQVDLQAMDRAHRIGQLKPVQVFRFVTEGTVEEKILERADRKLFLDAAVIQQGRLAEQNKSVNKEELMKMVRFGADQILSGKGGTYTDEDIDALIAKGEQKTSDMQAKLNTDAQHNLADFTLLGDDDTKHDTFAFEGENWRDADKKKDGMFGITLPQRERKRNYDVNEYFRETMKQNEVNNAAKGSADLKVKKLKKAPVFPDYQLYDKERLEFFYEREKLLVQKKEEHLEAINVLRTRAKRMKNSGSEKMCDEITHQADEMEKVLDGGFELLPTEKAEKKRLRKEGFSEWTKKEFKVFCSSLELHGRYDIKQIVQTVMSETDIPEHEVKRYYVFFWLHYRRISDFQKIIDKIERGEKKILRLRQIRDAIGEKVERHLDRCFVREGYTVEDHGSSLLSTDLIANFWSTMKIVYVPGTKNRSYTEEEDSFLLAMMHRHGYGAAHRIRLEIRRAWQFRFDWHFKSRNAEEIQKRCDLVVKSVEKEVEDIRKREEQELHMKCDAQMKANEQKREEQELHMKCDAQMKANEQQPVNTNIDGHNPNPQVHQAPNAIPDGHNPNPQEHVNMHVQAPNAIPVNPQAHVNMQQAPKAIPVNPQAHVNMQQAPITIPSVIDMTED